MLVVFFSLLCHLYDLFVYLCRVHSWWCPRNLGLVGWSFESSAVDARAGVVAARRAEVFSLFLAAGERGRAVRRAPALEAARPRREERARAVGRAAVWLREFSVGPVLLGF